MKQISREDKSNLLTSVVIGGNTDIKIVRNKLLHPLVATYCLKKTCFAKIVCVVSVSSDSDTIDLRSCEMITMAHGGYLARVDGTTEKTGNIE